MASIPVVWLISIFALLLVAIVARQIRLPLFARASFCVGLVSITIVAVLVGARFMFNDPAFVALQPYVATVTAPAFWLGFRALSTQPAVPKRPTLIISSTVVALACFIISLPYPWTATVAVTIVNTIFIVPLFGLLRLPSERFVHIAPQAYPALRTALIGCLAFFLLVVAIDSSLLLAALTAGEARAMALISKAAIIIVIVITLGVAAGLALVIDANSRGEKAEQPTTLASDEDCVIFENLNALMTETTLFRDPEITVARLGRRLGVPARSVSSAVNRVSGENISRYINRLRIRHAAELLERTNLPVTDVMLESGFLSKSSFNSEFRRITGQTPSGYRKNHLDGTDPVRKQASERSVS